MVSVNVRYDCTEDKMLSCSYYKPFSFNKNAIVGGSDKVSAACFMRQALWNAHNTP